MSFVLHQRSIIERNPRVKRQVQFIIFIIFVILYNIKFQTILT